MIRFIFKYIFLLLIRFYKNFISPHLPNSCRYNPTCSTYAIQAIQKYGPWKGLYLTVKRILRCHPFHPGGDDPLP